MPRRPYDFYETPPHYTAVLLKEITVRRGQTVFEPCVGDGAITRVLTHTCPGLTIITNDIDSKRRAQHHGDARDRCVWRDAAAGWSGGFSWAIFNPPFSAALALAEHALAYADRTAMLVRLSFLEPTADRERFLANHPPTRVIVLPRHSFRNRDDGKRGHDSVTCAWLVWDNDLVPGLACYGQGSAFAAAAALDLYGN